MRGVRVLAKRYGPKLGGLALVAATASLAASTADDILVFQHCSRKAFRKAEGDERLQELLGAGIHQGGWREATIGFAHKGQLVSCSFPIYGTQGSAEIKLRAVRAQESGITTNLFKSGQWELVSLEAYIPQLDGGLQHINLNE